MKNLTRQNPRQLIVAQELINKVKSKCCGIKDYCKIPVDKNSIKSAYKRIRNYLETYLPPVYVVNPPVVLLRKSDKERGHRTCAAWQYPKADDGSIPTDTDGNRLPRELNKKSPSHVNYFYRKKDIPVYKFDSSHNFDKNYVQAAYETDPEKNYPQICDISPFSLVNAGDLVFACSTQSKNIVALLEIISVQKEQIDFKIVYYFDTPFPISSLEEPYCDYCKENSISFFHVTNKAGKDIIESIEKSTEAPVSIKTIQSYSKEKLLKEVYIDEEIVQSIFDGLDSKKNIILQGAPGVGKTYIAKRIAYARMGKKFEYRTYTIQFHPNYTYEDFVIGYKPNKDGLFELQDGVFKRFCDIASKPKNKDNDYYFIIDEINRGNLNKIFGEAFTLIEKSYRGEYLKLAYPNKVLKIPQNVYIIGLMNTADRSLAMFDSALRRRFKFFTLVPAFGNPKFKTDQKKLQNKQFDKVIDAVVKLNNKIEKDPTLGNGFCIGHSYFCNKDGLNPIGLKSIIEDEIIPLLREYWFDDDDSVFESKIKELRDALNTQNDNE